MPTQLGDMLRFMLRLRAISTWLDIQRTPSPTPPYEHVLATERANGRSQVQAELRQLFQAVHDDARRALRQLAGTSLDPLDPTADSDPAFGFPEVLALSNLQGYTGEILAGICAENLPPWSEEGWEVPLFLFRLHNDAFRRLPYFAISSNSSPVPGRTGDDCLAFKRDAGGAIVAVMACEAKCTLDHDSTHLREAHEKASLSRRRSVDVVLLANAIADSGIPNALEWSNALRALSRTGNEESLRRDQITYVCGRSRVSPQPGAWLSRTERSSYYTASRSLQCVEMHLRGVEAFIRAMHDPASDADLDL